MKENYTGVENSFDRSISFMDCSVMASRAWQSDGMQDITTDAVFNLSAPIEGMVIARQSCIFAGTEEFSGVFRDPRFKIEYLFKEGSQVQPNSKVIIISGPSSEIFRRIRTAINYLQILSGIATITNQYNQQVGGKITALRKFHPYMGSSEKRAVQVGGGMSHRLSLADGYMLKSYQIDCLSQSRSLSIPEAIAKGIEDCKDHRSRSSSNWPIEVEARSMEEALEAAKGGVDSILLDNMDPKTAVESAKKLKKDYPKILIEVSGGITLDNIKSYDCKWIDAISSSEIIFKAKPIDLSFQINR